MDSVCRLIVAGGSSVDMRYLHDTDLRQHLDGPGLFETRECGRRLQDYLLRPAAEGSCRSRGLQGPEQTGRLRPDWPCKAYDTHEGVLCTRLPGAGRRGTRGAL